MPSGTLKVLLTREHPSRSGGSGFGFITQDDGPDVFVPFSELKALFDRYGGEEGLWAELQKGQIRVAFKTERTKRGLQATDVAPLVPIPEGLERVQVHDWMGEHPPFICDVWNPKNPRGGDKYCRAAMATGEYFQLFHHVGRHGGDLSARAVVHKSLAGLAAMAEGLNQFSTGGGALWVRDGIGYAFVSRLPREEIFPRVWEEAAKHAGLERVEVVLAEEFHAYVLQTWHRPALLGDPEHEEFVLGFCTGLVDHTDEVRNQHPWKWALNEDDLTTEMISAFPDHSEAARLLTDAATAHKRMRYQLKDGRKAQVFLALVRQDDAGTRYYSAWRLKGLELPESPESELVAGAREWAEYQASMADQPSLASTSLEVREVGGVRFVIGVGKYAAPNGEPLDTRTLPILEVRCRNNKVEASFDASASGHGRAAMMSPCADHETVSLCRQGRYAQSVDLEAEAARIAELADQQVRQARAGKTELRISDESLLEVVEYDTDGEPHVCEITEIDTSDRWNHWVRFQNLGGSADKIRVEPNSRERRYDAAISEAVRKTRSALRPRCEQCGELLVDFYDLETGGQKLSCPNCKEIPN